MTAPGGGGHMDLTPLWLPLAVESSGLNQQMAKAGQQASRSFNKATQGIGAGMADAVAQAAQKAQQATKDLDRVTDAHEKKERAAADAADKHRVALAKLADVEGNAKAKGGQLAAAQVAVSTAQRKADATAKDLKRSFDQQAKAADAAKSATRELASAQERTANAAPASGGRAARFFDSIRGSARQATSEVRGAESAIKQATASAGESGGSATATGFMAGMGGRMATGMSGMGESAAGAFGGSMIGGVATRLAGAVGKAGPIGAAVAGIALVGLGTGAALFNQIMAGAQREASQDVVQASLGIDDATMKRIAAAAAGSYTSVFGDSIQANMGDVKAAIQAGLMPSTAGQGEMQRTINGLETIRTIMGAEVPEAARAAGQMMRTGLAANSQEAFDIIIRGTQLGMDKSGDWLDTLNEYSVQFAKLGIDGKEALGLINQMVQAGARDSDVAADALKEFSIRVVDNSDLTKEAFQTLGLPAEATAQAFAQGGESARNSIDSVVKALNQVEDPVRRNTLGVALFGTQFEDLGSSFAAMNPDTAVAGLGKVDGAAKNAADTIGKNLPTSWEGFKRTIEVGLQSVQNSMSAAFGPQLQKWVDAISTHQPEIIGFFAGVGDKAIWASAVALDSMGDFVMGMSQVVGMVGDTLGALYKADAAFNDFMGNHERAAEERKLSETMFGLDKTIYRAGQAMKDTAAEGNKYRDVLRAEAKQAQTNAEITRDLGGATAELRGTDIIITDNAPEVLDKIDKTKWELVHLPDGTVKLVAKTKQAEEDAARWRSAQEDAPVKIPVHGDFTDFFKGAPANDPYTKDPLGAPLQPPAPGTPLPPSPKPPPAETRGGLPPGAPPGSGTPGAAPPLTDILLPPGGGMGPGGRPQPGSARVAAAPGGASSQQQVARYIYSAAIARGYPPEEALAIVAYAVGESGLNPGISGGVQGDDEVIGLFQEKQGFARAGGIDPSQRGTTEGNVTAYLNNLVKNRGAGDIYDQLLATSVGGPMHTGGRAYMAQLVARARGYLGFQHGGMIPLDPNWASPGDPGYIDPSTVGQNPYYRGGTPHGWLDLYPEAAYAFLPGALQESGKLRSSFAPFPGIGRHGYLGFQSGGEVGGYGPHLWEMYGPPHQFGEAIPGGFNPNMRIDTSHVTMTPRKFPFGDYMAGIVMGTGQPGTSGLGPTPGFQTGGMVPVRDPRGVDPHGGKEGGRSLGPFAPWWDMDWMPPEHPEKVGPSLPGVEGKWWHRGPVGKDKITGGGQHPWAPPIGKYRPPLPGDPYPGMIPDWEIKWFGRQAGGLTGRVPGIDMGGDRVPIMAQPREFVVRQRQAEKWLPLLHDLNAGNGIFGMEQGGVVPELQYIDQLATQAGLTVGSGQRAEAGSFHNTGEARDYNGPEPQMTQFAQYLANTYGSKLAELIHDAPGFTSNIGEGKVVGAFGPGQYYNEAQAGEHKSHVHVAVHSVAEPGGVGNQTIPGVSALSGAVGAPGGAPGAPGSLGPADFSNRPMSAETAQSLAEEQEQRTAAITDAERANRAANEALDDAIYDRDQAQLALDTAKKGGTGQFGQPTPADPAAVAQAQRSLDLANRTVRDQTEALADSETTLGKARTEAAAPSKVLADAAKERASDVEKAVPDANAQTLGGGLVTGALEALGFDNSVFGDPTQWGIWKLFTGTANYIGGAMAKQREMIAEDTGMPVDSGGGGGLFDALLGGAVAATGLEPGPGLSVPSAVSATAAPGSAVAPAENVPGSPGFTGPTGAPPGPALDQSVNFYGPVNNAPAAEVAGINHLHRQPDVGFPAGAPAPVG